MKRKNQKIDLCWIKLNPSVYDILTVRVLILAVGIIFKFKPSAGASIDQYENLS
jgi:hypothetical protein